MASPCPYLNDCSAAKYKPTGYCCGNHGFFRCGEFRLRNSEEWGGIVSGEDKKVLLLSYRWGKVEAQFKREKGLRLRPLRPQNQP